MNTDPSTTQLPFIHVAHYKTATHLTAAGSQGPRKNPVIGSWIGTNSDTTDTSGAPLLNVTSSQVRFDPSCTCTQILTFIISWLVENLFV